MLCFSYVIPTDNKHLMTGPKGNSEFCFPETLNVPRGEAEVNIEGREETKLTWKLSSKFCSLQKSLNVFTALWLALLVDFELLLRRSCSISSSVLVV